MRIGCVFREYTQRLRAIRVQQARVVGSIISSELTGEVSDNERQTKHSKRHQGDDNNANTGDIDGRDDRQGAVPLSRARDDTAIRDPPRPRLWPRHHTTRNAKYKAGGEERAGRRADGGRAGVHAHARVVLVALRDLVRFLKTIGCLSSAVPLVSTDFDS